MKNIELDLQKITINEDRNKIIRDTLRENEVDVKKDIPTPKRWSFDDLKKTKKLLIILNLFLTILIQIYVVA